MKDFSIAFGLWFLTLFNSCLSSKDFRVVHLSGLERFSEPSLGPFSEILFDVSRLQMIVGARDTLFRLSLEGLSLLEKANWSANSEEMTMCAVKGQSVDECRNYIKVLVSRLDEVFACGTRAFSPSCSWRPLSEISKVISWVDGRGKCPYSPTSNSSALLSSEGNYYSGSSIDFSSSEHAIIKMSGEGFKDYIGSAQGDSKWLSQPNFVGNFETEDFVYFVFRETAVEYINCGKAIYSRIARVCKNDGGSKSIWTTFLKARLNCSLPGDYPFYFNEIQSMFYLEEASTIYASFSTPINSLAGSAICSFTLEDLNTAFQGPFKWQSRPDSTWEPLIKPNNQFYCSGQSELPSSRDYQLVDYAVSSVGSKPLYHENEERYHHIAVESIENEISNFHVLFVSTRNGQIKKFTFNTKNYQSCLIEILILSESRIHIRNMKILQATHSLYLTTDDSVLRIPNQRCKRFSSFHSCSNSMDPYCSWNKKNEECSFSRSSKVSYWVRNPSILSSCPKLTNPINGGWSDWTPWFKCNYTGLSFSHKDDPLYCQCRIRKCEAPTPLYGGLPCSGSTNEVSNCTRHGQWSEWSDFSSCSQTCDVGIQIRKRACVNPSPAFGGQNCIGRDTDRVSCKNTLSCSSVSSKDSYMVGERWSSWTSWSDCSSDCGSGFRSRTRSCLSNNCSSCSNEYVSCNVKKCTEYSTVTDVTPWIKVEYSSKSGTWNEKRFSFTYKTPSFIQSTGSLKEETRLCSGLSSPNCQSLSSQILPGSEDWTTWSKCTRECGGGYQVKLRTSTSSPNNIGCSKMTQLERPCNTQPCEGGWNCWTDWSSCKLIGENFKKKRSRQCVSPTSDLHSCQNGFEDEEEECEGWSPWSEFSSCDSQGFKRRTRSCSSEICSGLDSNVVLCSALDFSPQGSSFDHYLGFSSTWMIICTLSGFLSGVIVGGLSLYLFLRYKAPSREDFLGISPHYLSVKNQNLYVSLPLLDLKNKLPSLGQDFGTLRSGKTGSSIYNDSRSSDYDTATIKRTHRNSNVIHGGGTLRANLDSNQLFT